MVSRCCTLSYVGFLTIINAVIFRVTCTPPFGFCSNPNDHSKQECIRRRIKEGTYDLNKLNGRSQQLRDLIQHMLAYDEHDRYSAEQVFNDPWVQTVQILPSHQLLNSNNNTNDLQNLIDGFGIFLFTLLFSRQ